MRPNHRQESTETGADPLASGGHRPFIYRQSPPPPRPIAIWVRGGGGGDATRAPSTGPVSFYGGAPAESRMAMGPGELAPKPASTDYSSPTPQSSRSLQSLVPTSR